MMRVDMEDEQITRALDLIVSRSVVYGPGPADLRCLISSMMAPSPQRSRRM
jgi:hypothetical protein